MSLLLALTLTYVAILVLALASGLIAIVYFLNGARANLAGIAAGLQEVNQHVEPLQNTLAVVNDGLTTLLGHLQTAQRHLSSAAAKLAEGRRAS
jgi:predicted PurR-regulated permease PerM